ncbi:MAG: pseudouridine synthase [Chitinispirillaceae bacterium]
MSETKHLRVDRILSNLGYCSRREAKSFLRDHEIVYEGRCLRDPSQKADPRKLKVDGEKLDHPCGILVVLNKPQGYVCSHDPSEGPRVYDLLPSRWLDRNPRVSSVGRLDKDTTGVLLVTDDTRLVHTLTSPRHHVKKTYLATLDRPLEERVVAQFASGTLLLEGEKIPCRPAELRILEPGTRAEVVLTEGRYHQVKRMFAACGYRVVGLHRERFGGYGVEGLGEGEWREVTPEVSL